MKNISIGVGVISFILLLFVAWKVTDKKENPLFEGKPTLVITSTLDSNEVKTVFDIKNFDRGNLTKIWSVLLAAQLQNSSFQNEMTKAVKELSNAMNSVVAYQNYQANIDRAVSSTLRMGMKKNDRGEFDVLLNVDSMAFQNDTTLIPYLYNERYLKAINAKK